MRCKSVLHRGVTPGVQVSLAFTLAAAALFVIANSVPFLEFNFQGNAVHTTVLTGVAGLYQEGFWELAALVLLTIFVAPAAQLLLQLYILLPLALGRAPAGLPIAMRLYHASAYWTMADVFMLGALVAMVKLLGLADVIPGIGFISLAVLVFILIASGYTMNTHWIWQHVPVEHRSVARPLDARSVLSCPTCDRVVQRPEDSASSIRCERCGTVLHYRKPHSIQRSWALMIAAVVLYIPANALPIMTVTSLGATESNTILSGVKFLWLHDWPLAVIVFVASILVPAVKVVVLLLLLVTVQFGLPWRPVDRTRLYHVAELIGRWSMVDIYVVTVLVALVRLGGLASMQAELGAVFFGSVVVLTMLAYNTFDPRLIWDSMED